MGKTVELLIDRPATDEEKQGLFMKSPDLKRLLKPGYTVRRDKTGSFYVKGTEDGEIFDLGISLFMAISRAYRL